jgi:hypothetical protein
MRRIRRKPEGNGKMFNEFCVLFSLATCLQVIRVTSRFSTRVGRVSTQTQGHRSVSYWPHIVCNIVRGAAVMLVCSSVQTCVVTQDLRFRCTVQRFWGWLGGLQATERRCIYCRVHRTYAVPVRRSLFWGCLVHSLLKDDESTAEFIELARFL